MNEFLPPNLNELGAAVPGIGKLANVGGQPFVTRIAVIDDPFFLKLDDHVKQKRHPLLGSTWDNELFEDDANPKDVPENEKFTTNIPKTQDDYAPVNRSTRKVMVRFLDEAGGLARKKVRETYKNPLGQTMKGYGRYERAFVSMSSSGFYTSRRNDDGQGNGPHVWAGFDFMPPPGTKVIVGFRRGQEPYIVTYLQDIGTWFTPNTSQTAKQLGSENSVIQNGFDVDINGPRSTDPFRPTIDPLNMGAARFGSYGGSYFLADNHADNFTKRSRAQKSDIVVQHTLGSFFKIHSDTIEEAENFPGEADELAQNVNQGNGTVTIQHNSGSYFEIEDGGSILLSDAPVQKRLDIFPWRPQDKSENTEDNETLIDVGEHRSLEDLRNQRINPHGRGNFLFMDARDKILLQDTALDYLSLQNDNITLRNNSQTFISIEGDKFIARNANGSQFMIDGDQISMKDKNGNHILLDGDTIQLGNSQGTTMRIGKDGLSYSNASGSVIHMNGDGIGYQTKTGAKIEKLEDTINFVAKTINLTAEEYNIVTGTTNMHSDKSTNVETGLNLNFKVAGNESHEVNKNLETKSNATSIKATREIQLKAKLIKEN